MNNLSINNGQSFTGKYRVNLIFNKQGTPKDLSRDLMLGQWLDHATNTSELVKKIRQHKNTNKNNTLTLDYIIPQKSESLFEHCMRLVEQKFEKLG